MESFKIYSGSKLLDQLVIWVGDNPGIENLIYIITYLRRVSYVSIFLLLYFRFFCIFVLYLYLIIKMGLSLVSSCKRKCRQRVAISNRAHGQMIWFFPHKNNNNNNLIVNIERNSLWNVVSAQQSISLCRRNQSL